VDALLRDVDDLAVGYLVGLLVGEGHFGGDGRQPQITLRMHIRHQAVFRWLQRQFPGSALYGPYHHGGRSYFQWMVRGTYLRHVVAPLLQRHRDWFDDHTLARFTAMCENYAIALPEAPASDTSTPTVADYRRDVTPLRDLSR
jgi:hypothetical protein